MSTPAIFLGDLLRATAGLDASQRDAAALALGFSRPTMPRKRRRKAATRTLPPEPRAADAEPSHKPVAAVPPRSEPKFWRIAADVRWPAERLEVPVWLSELEGKAIPEGCFVSDPRIALPKPAPLQPPARQARFLRQQLARPRPGSEPDLPWLLRKLSNGQPVDKLRPEPLMRWPHTVQLVIDNGSNLGPLWRDLDGVAAHLRKMLGQRLRVLACDGAPGALRDARGRPAKLVQDANPLIVLGAAGAVGDAHPDRSAWLAWAAAWRRQSGSAPLLVAPLPQRLLAPACGEAFKLAVLDESRHLHLRSQGSPTATATPAGRTAPGEPSPALAAMLALLAGISCITPPLLRLVRQALRRLGLAGADVGAELEFLHLPEVVGNAAGCRVRPAHHAAVFARLPRLIPDAAQRHALAWQVRGWVLSLSPLLQAEHWDTLQQHMPDLLDRQDLGKQQAQRANDLWAWYAEGLRREPQRSDLRGYVGWLVEHNPAMLNANLPGLHLAWALAHPDRLADPASLPPGLALEQFAWLLPAGPPLTLVWQGFSDDRRDGATMWLLPEDQAGAGAVLCHGLPGAPHFAVEDIGRPNL